MVIARTESNGDELLVKNRPGVRDKDENASASIVKIG